LGSKEDGILHIRLTERTKLICEDLDKTKLALETKCLYG